MKSLAAWTLILILSCPMAFAKDLVIERSGVSVKHTSASLLKRTKPVELSPDPTYGSPITYRVISMKDLFAGKLPPRASALLFEATDGFRVSIPSEKLFYTEGADALLAIEDPAKPWPHIKKKKASAGPYYLIWTGPQAAKKVGQEEWPFMVAKIIVQKSFAEEYPQLEPQVKLSSDVYKGYLAFAKNCFACHALDDVGGEKMGPDLNIPHSPTEYLRKEYFVKLIRNPQSMRKWQNSQMSAFDEAALSRQEIDQIWEYLGYMKTK